MIYSALARVVSAVLSMFIMLVSAKIIGVEGRAYFSVLISLGGVLGVFACFGGNKVVVENSAKAIGLDLSLFAKANLLFSISCAILYFIFSKFSLAPENFRKYSFFNALFIISSSWQVLSPILFSLKNKIFIQDVIVLFGKFFLLIVFFVFWDDFDTYWFLAFFSFFNLIVVIVEFFLLFGVRFNDDDKFGVFDVIKSNLISGMKYVPDGIGSTFLNLFPVVIVSNILTLTQVGNIGLAFQAANLMLLPATVFSYYVVKCDLGNIKDIHEVFVKLFKPSVYYFFLVFFAWCVLYFIDFRSILHQFNMDDFFPAIDIFSEILPFLYIIGLAIIVNPVFLVRGYGRYVSLSTFGIGFLAILFDFVFASVLEYKVFFIHHLIVGVGIFFSVLFLIFRIISHEK